MSDLEKAFGTPIDNFQTFNAEETICCISGLTYPQTRLELVYNKVAENKDLIKKNLAATRETGLKGGVKFPGRNGTGKEKGRREETAIKAGYYEQIFIAFRW